MNIESIVLCVFEMREDKAYKITEESDILDVWRTSKYPVWIHMDGSQPEDCDMFLSKLHIKESQRKRLVDLSNHTFNVKRGLNGLTYTLKELSFKDGKESITSLNLWTDQNRLITVRKDYWSAVTLIKKSLESGEKHIDIFYIISELTDHMVSETNNTISALDQCTTQFEEELIDNQNINRTSFMRIYKQLLSLNKFLPKQHENLIRLYNALTHMSKTEQIYLQNVVSHMNSCAEELRTVQGRIRGIQDQIIMFQNEDLNSKMYILNVISIIFLPLTFITGLLGINVRGIPFSTDKYSFDFVLLTCFLLALLTYLLISNYDKIKKIIQKYLK